MTEHMYLIGGQVERARARAQRGAGRTAVVTALASLLASAAGCDGLTSIGGVNGTGGALAGPRCTGADCSKVTAVAAGWYHTCALMADATMRCWGNNYGGMLGVASGSATVPTPVPGLSGIARIYADYTGTSAQLDDGSVLMWGANHNGQLGDGTTDGRLQPTVALPFAVREITMGEYHACALLLDGTVS